MSPRPPTPTAVPDLALAALRSEIDEVDDAMLVLIERRQKLARKINDLKPPVQEGLKLRPDREAHVVGRLLERAPAIDRRLVLALWREILSAGLAVQTELTVVVASEAPEVGHAARLRFGVSAQYRTATAEQALAAAEGEAAIAVLDPGDSCPWWTGLPDRSDLWIFERLAGEGTSSALVVGRVRPESLARGVTFAVTSQDSPPASDEEVLATAGRLRLVQSPDQSAWRDRGRGFVGSAPLLG